MTEAVLAPARPRRSTSVLNVLLAMAALVAVAGVAFAVGRLTSPSSTAVTSRGGNAGQFGGQLAPGPRASGGPSAFGRVFAGAPSIQGTVTAVSADSLTIALPNGESVTLTTDDSTTFHRQAAASSSDVAVGKDVIVQLSGRDGPGPGESAAPNASGSPELKASSVTLVAP